MKTRLSLFILVLAFALFTALSAFAIEGTVVKQNGDRYIIETDEGYSMAIFRDGYAPEVGDVLMGALTKKGVHTIYNVSADEEVVMSIGNSKFTKNINQPANVSVNVVLNGNGDSDYQMSGNYGNYKHHAKHEHEEEND